MTNKSNWRRRGGPRQSFGSKLSHLTGLFAALILTVTTVACASDSATVHLPGDRTEIVEKTTKAEPAVKVEKSVEKKTDAKKPDTKKPDTKKADAKKADTKKQDAKTTAKAKDAAVPAWKKSAPETVADLKAIQDRVQSLLAKLIPATVGVEVGGARGSGVIISGDGYVLTAGHVSGTPKRNVTIILPDGKRIKGKALGRNTGIDSGMFKIDSDRKDWPHVEMGKSKSISMGDWAIAIGHPGGWQRGRPPVVRLGRIISANDRVVWTDATLVGGDSGGPLFDFDGKVIGIHSRISVPTTANFHVPIDTYHDTWDRLAASEEFSDRPSLGAVAGINAENHKSGARLTAVVERSPADRAGLEVGDIITKFGNRRLKKLQDLVVELKKKNPTDSVTIEYLRGEEKKTTRVTLGASFPASPFLGITGREGNNAGGASIRQVFEGTPAASAKLKVDDLITGFNGKKIRSLSQLQDNIRKLNAGEEVDLDVKRGSETLKLKLTLGMRG